ncbi:hypothetical protein Q5H93_22280 [Hymenobacter sp. ASUV-10]|uniref:Lipoprotein n=1 Tax=Hymenobacter aranciens TaxID=3063996 RepID=A0ABT9BLQ4_9BACT|nr:hypothetical protein [Hymenobacter sp. ASUV-10]MDO7877483.1 hypothetical protein [Hymenobacter sp. ASUV-10]
MTFSTPFGRKAIALLAFAALTACSDDSDGDLVAPAKGMSWTVDGTATTANSYQPNVSGTDVILTGSAISSAAFSSVTLTLPLQTGTYNLATVGSDVKAVYVAGTGNTNGTAYYATSGTATVTSATATSYMGTFSFSGTDANGTASKTISSGKFNVTL